MKEDISAVANVVSSQDSVEREKEERKIQIKHDAGKNFPFTHIAAIHTHSTASLFSSDSAESLSLRGTSASETSQVSIPTYLNLLIQLVLVLVANNLRLIIENHAKYGLLLTIPTNLFGTSDFLVASILAFAIPLHLLVSFVIEVSAAKESLSAKKDGSVTKRRQWWDIIALAHSANVALCLGISSWAVYTRIYHPVLGFITETHAVIVCLKLASYALTNRDLRDAYLKSEPIPAAYMDGPMYPDLSIHQLLYFWLAPTLIYQPCYPRTARFRKSFFIKRATEFLVLLFALWFIVAQYAVPLCRNSVEAMENLDIRRILERLLKLSTISVICWCAGFFCFFQSGLNACAEAMRFADRTFYLDWWNAGDMYYSSLLYSVNTAGKAVLAPLESPCLYVL
ncbi:Diacylglycerol O-acyltransferase 1 [Neolecta irregularis DAH-3]|uniref:diacylglycerol O-acyltransferase n=1 Tax=Neolecta irregularis (strain DAH-3) TaxID=1198029 RepID=A0A1U7LPV5_NEOID|nr:Diacylglycerol O-acyltransferase 1 [Neolecta irregularis DAH-3]|eukprot:OLL24658.1 Diacylglycerol O-acyltransferase 1 [Neolecta irregularis DAH-3]